MQGSIPCLRFALLLTPPTATASYPQLSPLHYILCPLGRALGAGGTPLSHHSWHHPPHSCCHSCSRGGGSGPAEEGPAPATATGGLQRAHLLCHSWYSWHRPPPDGCHCCSSGGGGRPAGEGQAPAGSKGAKQTHPHRRTLERLYSPTLYASPSPPPSIHRSCKYSIHSFSSPA